MSSIENVSGMANPTVTKTNTSDVKDVKKNKSFIDVFKAYYDKHIKKGNNDFHDVTVDDVNSTAKQVYDDLIRSGAKVVSHDKKTGITKFDNGVEIYYTREDGEVSFSASCGDNGNYLSGTIATTESADGCDSNEITILEDSSLIDNIDKTTTYTSTIEGSSRTSSGIEFIAIGENYEITSKFRAENTRNIEKNPD